VPSGGEEDRTQEQESADDAFIKSSTDKLSVVFDWLAAPAKLASKGKPVQHDLSRHVTGDGSPGGNERSKMDGGRSRNELETKLDLERFYIALSRKIYDEGL
jgi:triacylglycerol lipase